MIYYSEEARKSAIDGIKDCMKKISLVSGTELAYMDASNTINYLAVLLDEIERESRDQNRKRRKIK